MQRFDNRRIIVTGAGSGIGAATVARLLDEGGTVMGLDVNERGLAATAAAADDNAAKHRHLVALMFWSMLLQSNDARTPTNTASTIGTRRWRST